MLTILLVIQAIITLAMIAIILIQRTSSDGLSGLGGGGGSGSGNSLLSGRASANILTKSTTFLAIAFMANSLAMAAITTRSTQAERSLFEQAEEQLKEESKELPTPTVPLAE